MKSLALLVPLLLAIAGCSAPEEKEMKTESPVERVKDPVCGMEIEAASAMRRVEFYGTTYYFCSDECYQAFRRTPEAYMVSDRLP